MTEITEDNCVLSELDMVVIEEAFGCLKKYWECENSKMHLDYIFKKVTKLNDLAKQAREIPKLEFAEVEEISEEPNIFEELAKAVVEYDNKWLQEQEGQNAYDKIDGWKEVFGNIFMPILKKRGYAHE